MLLKQLDRLLTEEEWDADDTLPKIESWKTFARLLIYLNPQRMPGVGFHNGNAMASWLTEDIRITIECFPEDQVSWVASRLADGPREVSAGESHVRRVPAVLAAYNDKHWVFQG